MKIGIITKIGKNYGALLQAYALKTAFSELGTQAHIIRFEPEITRRSYKVCREPWRFRGVIANLRALAHYKANKAASERFLRFREEHFSFLGNCTQETELHQLPECDIYVSGSDQVWNPTISFSPAYYCSFAKAGKRVVSYAASIGLKKIPEQYEEEFFSRVARFDYISVREKQAQQLLADNGIAAEVAPDPTLLFDSKRWNELAIDTVTEPYILCYFVSTPKNIAPLVSAVRDRLKLKVVNLMMSESSAGIGDVVIRDAGPQEFLGLFKNASFVITSSFHGTVFSLINEKPFITTLYQQTGNRVVNLLESVGLEGRIVSPEERDAEKYLKAEALYSAEVKDKITALRENGIEILKKIIGE